MLQGLDRNAHSQLFLHNQVLAARHFAKRQALAHMAVSVIPGIKSLLESVTGF